MPFLIPLHKNKMTRRGYPMLLCNYAQIPQHKNINDKEGIYPMLL
jgi:hypothetical protein